MKIVSFRLWWPEVVSRPSSFVIAQFQGGVHGAWPVVHVSQAAGSDGACRQWVAQDDLRGMRAGSGRAVRGHGIGKGLACPGRKPARGGQGFSFHSFYVKL